MVTYEVNIGIQEEIQKEFLPWLESHIQEMLAIPGFISAELFQVKGDPLQFCVHYLLRDMTILDYYLENEAPQMRKDGLRRFGSKMKVHRRIMLRKGTF